MIRYQALPSYTNTLHIDLFDLTHIMGPSLVRPLRVKVDLRIMVWKDTLLSPDLQNWTVTNR